LAALRLYLDASVIAPLFLPDVFIARSRSLLAAKPQVIISDFAAAEFCSIVGIRVRTGDITRTRALAALSNFDTWRSDYAAEAKTASEDIETAQGFLRRLDLTLRAPDAINLATAQRLGADVATFDTKMAACARKLSISVAAV
jgi:hypothetical protein